MLNPVASLRFCAYLFAYFNVLFDISVTPTVGTAGVVLPRDSFLRVGRAGPENGPFYVMEWMKIYKSMHLWLQWTETSKLTLRRENNRIVISHLSRRVSQFILCTRWRINTCYSML